MLAQAIQSMVNGVDFQVIGEGLSYWYDSLFVVKDYHQWVLIDIDSGRAVVFGLEDVSSVSVELHKIFVTDECAARIEAARA